MELILFVLSLNTRIVLMVISSLKGSNSTFGGVTLSDTMFYCYSIGRKKKSIVLTSQNDIRTIMITVYRLYLIFEITVEVRHETTYNNTDNSIEEALKNCRSQPFALHY